MIERISIASVFSIIYVMVVLLAAYTYGWVFVDENKPIPEGITIDEMRVFYGAITLSLLWAFGTCVEVIVKIFKVVI